MLTDNNMEASTPSQLKHKKKEIIFKKFFRDENDGDLPQHNLIRFKSQK
jgi:hypothetical protein